MFYRLAEYWRKDAFARWFVGGSLLFFPLFYSIVIVTACNTVELRAILPLTAREMFDLQSIVLPAWWIPIVVISSVIGICVLAGTLAALVVTRSRRDRAAR